MAKDLSYLFSQLRRIEDHREEKAEKEIRKIYKQMLKDTRQFIAEEYYNLAEDGKLTFDILRGKGQEARFMEEVEQRLGGLSSDVSKEIRKTVEEMYQLSFDGLRDAVKKSKDAEQLKELLDVPSINTAQTMWASVNNTIMDIALEKNHKDNIWNIKREVATALTVGDRFDTMADRLAKSLNGNYKKANLIARTEMGRVREAGHLAAAKDINETIAQGSSGLRMVKKWMSMRDGKVRDQHQEMHGTVVEMNELFELPDGTKTQAPKQSGVARHDCNCRCTCLYPLMDDEMFFKATGKHFKNYSENGVEKSEKSDNIEMYKKTYKTIPDDSEKPDPKNDGISTDPAKIFADAKSGTRHGGIYRDALVKTEKQLKKSIASHNKEVEIHRDKIANPEKYVKDWDSKTEQEKDGLLRKWRKDMKRNAEQAVVEEEAYKERFKNEH